MTIERSPLFTPTTIANSKLKNRLVVAPMTRVSANANGTMTKQMARYYQNFADGGFALIITEGLYTDKSYSQAYRYQPGIASLQQAQSWQPLISKVQAKGGLLIAQLMHAGALSQYNKYATETSAPSPVRPLGKQMPFYYGEGHYGQPKEMTDKNIKEVIQGFVTSALNAKSAGFNGVEIHGANGYLLDQFLTDYTNQRNDQYGGSLENRLRIYQEIFLAVRAAVGNEFIVGVRFSQKKVNDSEHVWLDGENAAQQIFTLVKTCQLDYIHTTEPVLTAPAFSGSPSLASLAKKYSGLPVIANGGVFEASLATRALENNQADMVAVGRAALVNQNWPEAVKQGLTLKTFTYDMFNPIANLDNANTYFKSA